MRPIFGSVAHAPGNLDSLEAATLERAVFGQSPAPRSRRATAQAGGAGVEGIDEVERAVFGGAARSRAVAAGSAAPAPVAGAPAACEDAVAAPAPAAAPEDAAALTAPEDAEGSGVPEADRLFAPPTAEEAERIVRDLPWGEHIVATRMSTSRGNTQTYLFSFEQAVTFFMEDHAGGARLATSGSTAWIDFDRFLAWMRDTVGDATLARVLEERLAERDAYNDRIETLRQLLVLRWAQLEPFAHPENHEPVAEDADEDAGVAPA